jgi:uncharacterized damage-inducible protein DinB
MAAVPEPWLRGSIAGLDPRVAPILYTFQQAREDLDLYAGNLTPAQLWAEPYGFGSVGFHLLHITGSTDRLMSYLEGRALTRDQFAALAEEEKMAGPSATELLAGMDHVFAAAEATVRAIDPSTLSEPRWVGRKRLPTTVAGLLTHIAEHIQRHVGQAISAAKLAQAIGNSSQS